ncbi:MAG TPA: ATP-dependent zinc metalloprotease FtsH [Hyphomicrobiales bacterium]|nr:ATP-dependent zinc metalloprotease FtsH [Hyphomicrobiales bacterium]
MQMKREHQMGLWYVALIVVGWLALEWLLSTSAAIRTIPYSQFQTLVAQHKVTDLVVGPDQITGTLVGETANGAPQRFATDRVPEDIAARLQTEKIAFSGKPAPGLLSTILGWLVPMLGFFALWMWLLRPMAAAGGAGAGGLLSIGKSRAKIYIETDTKVTFADVAGVDEAKEELREVVAFLKDPKSYGRLGAHIPKGVLLVGPPGTGKTLLARAVAGEAGVRFFSISGSEFVEMFVGVGAARVRDLFEQARRQAPAIVFIDELDALGRARGGVFPGGGHDEKEQTLNQLLTEMDGFDPSSGVVLLAATNRPEILDPALLRAGRFDRQILVDRPDKKGRVQILRVHVRKVKLADGVSLEEIAAMTPGFTGADLANLINEAALLATRRSADAVAMPDFTQAIERIVAGLEKKNRILTPHERAIVAHHELGHAIIAMALPGADPVQKISIIPRGIAALGYTLQRPTEDRFLMDRAELLDRMAVLLGGRAAEEVALGEISTGAADDLTKATAIARSMVTRFGMDPTLGQVAYEPERGAFVQPAEPSPFEPRRYSDESAAAIDAAVRTLIEDAARRAEAIIRANRALLEETAQRLLQEETLQGDALEALSAHVDRSAVTRPRLPVPASTAAA